MKDKTSKFFADIVVFISILFSVIVVSFLFYFIVIGVVTTVKDYKGIDSVELGYKKKSFEVHTDLQKAILEVSKVKTDSISKSDVFQILGKLDK